MKKLFGGKLFNSDASDDSPNVPPLRKPSASGLKGIGPGFASPRKTKGSAADVSSPARTIEEQVEIVSEKLKASNREARALKQQMLYVFALSLADPEKMQQKYLNPDFVGTASTLKELDDVQAKIKMSHSEGGSLLPASGATSSFNEAASRSMEEDTLEDIDFEEDVIEKESSRPEMQVNKICKCKLVITEICKSEGQKMFRKMMSPILTTLDVQASFGMFHSALVIGPWYLEWTNSSLCIPRRCYSSAAMIAADLSTDGMVKKINIAETTAKLATIIAHWNVNRTYDRFTSNCQTFVEDVMQALGLELKTPSGAMGQFLADLKQKGTCEISFSLTNELREQFGLKQQKQTFETHADLDSFSQHLLSVDPQFELNYKSEWSLLKSFDRAFWLRHFRDKQNPRFAPLDEDSCPFGDPQTTLSMKRDWF